jgi:hypothetical protein
MVSFFVMVLILDRGNLRPASYTDGNGAGRVAVFPSHLYPFPAGERAGVRGDADIVDSLHTPQFHPIQPTVFSIVDTLARSPANASLISCLKLIAREAKKQ